MSYPKPVNELARLAALERYRILDTASEPIYDDIVRLAAYVCDTPTALISLVDEHRQWFKAKVGMPLGETPREQAFCAHAIMGEHTLVVEDATCDKRFADNPLVTGDLGVRFYMGAPLTNADGEAVGSLCVMDTVPRHITIAQRCALESLRNVVVTLFEQRFMNRDLADVLERVRALEGLLPICMFCKSVRDDEGYWKRVEEYFGTHGGTEFSHSICPACMKQHYPEHCHADTPDDQTPHSN